MLDHGIDATGDGTHRGGVFYLRRTGGKIEGIRWVLKSYDSKGSTTTAPLNVSIDALFRGGKLSGFSGVNTYQGLYKLSGSNLSVGQLASTMMAGPKDLMDAE